MKHRRPEQLKSQEEEEDDEAVQGKQQGGDEEEETSYPAGPSTDLCETLIHRYSTSSSPHHLHLTAAAASFRSILQSSSLPLTPSSYFAAAISTLQRSLEDRTLTSEEHAAMLSFLSIVLPMVPDEGVSAARAKEAVGVLVEVARKEGLGVGSLVCVVKCVGLLLVMFCDKEDWGSVEEGFRLLLGYLLDRRPKVRRSAQECLEKVFKYFQSSTVLRKASKMVLSTFEKYIHVVASSSATSHEEQTMLEPTSKSESKEFLHMLNFVGAISPHLNAKVRSQTVMKVHSLINSEFTASTAVILKIIEAFLESQIDGDASSDIESIVISISTYVTATDNPDDTILSAANLLKVSLDKLRSSGSVLWIKYLPIICRSIAGLLDGESGTSLAASIILRDLIKRLIDRDTFLFDDLPSQGGIRESYEISTMKETCAIFEKSLSPLDEVPNPHLLSVICVLFLMLGKSSYFYMKGIILKLAHFLTNARKDQSSTVHLQVSSCIGYAVTAIGVERMLILFPIELHPDDFTYKNIWLVPILRDYVVSSSLAYYMDHIVPLAMSFRCASQKVSDPSLSKDLLSHASELWKLLPAFCRNPTDTSKQYSRLAELLVDLLKKEPIMHKTVALGLQVLVNQNKSVLGLQKISGKLGCFPVEKSIVDIQEISGFSKKSATRNIKAIASASSEVLQFLSKLFVESVTGSNSYLKDAIGCLASIADSSLTKEIFVSLLQSVNLNDGEHKVKSPKHPENLLTDKELECTVTAAKDANRCHLMEVAYSIVEGAKEDLVDLIFSFIKDMMQEDNDIGHREAYLALCRIVEEHPWFCAAHCFELMDFLFGVKCPSSIPTLRSRFACFHALMVYSLGRNLEEDEDAKAFLILNEVILALKNAKEEIRKEAYDMLLNLSTTLKGMESVHLTTPDHKLVNMIMGYLSSSSPQIKSGAVSALSVLVYSDANICISIPDLVPSLLSLLENKVVEVTKAILGFVKVLVSCLQAQDLQNLLSEVVSGIIPWSNVSRHHFRSKVTIILEIIIRKCGYVAVQSVIPDKYGGFLKTVMENRHSRTAKEVSTSLPSVSADLPSKRSREEPGGSEKDSMDQRRIKRSRNNHAVAKSKENVPFAGAESGSKRSRGKRWAGNQPQGIVTKGKRKFNQFRHGQNQSSKQKVRFGKVEGSAPARGRHREAKKGRGGKAGFRKDKQ